MKKYPTDKEIEEEVDYFLEHLDELAAKQQTERKAYFENPANAERIARTRQRLAIAEQLYKARHKAGLTQAEVAARMKVSQPLVARLERGRGNISCDTLMKYALACGCILTISLT